MALKTINERFHIFIILCVCSNITTNFILFIGIFLYFNGEQNLDAYYFLAMMLILALVFSPILYFLMCITLFPKRIIFYNDKICYQPWFRKSVMINYDRISSVCIIEEPAPTLQSFNRDYRFYVGFFIDGSKKDTFRISYCYFESHKIEKNINNISFLIKLFHFLNQQSKNKVDSILINDFTKLLDVYKERKKREIISKS